MTSPLRPSRPTCSWPPQQDCLPNQWASGLPPLAHARPRPLVPPPGELHNAMPDSAYWSHGMTSSIKPEEHNVSQCCQRKNELRIEVTCTNNLVKFGRAVFELCERTDRQIDVQTNKHILITILCNPTGANQMHKNKAHPSVTNIHTDHVAR